MASMGGREPGHLDIITKDIPGRGQRIVMASEKHFLMIPARSPGKHGSDIQVLSQHLTPHVVWFYAFLRAFIVTAARGMNMVVGTIPAQFFHIYPASQLKGRSIL